MKTIDNTRVSTTISFALFRLIAVLAVACLFYSQALAQQTAADTSISNTASATYSDGSGGNYSTSSNTVTVIVSKVSGLTITPDVTNGSSDPTVVPGQSNGRFTFTGTNTGNFTDNVRFKANGASVSIASGSATVASAFIDVNGNGTYEAGTDTLITGNASDVVSGNLAQNASLSVVVLVNVNAAAPAGSIINVRLGDTASGTNFDNQPANGSAAEVATESTGSRNATAITLANAPAGSNSGIFVFAPVPTGTTLAAQSFPAGTLYSNSPVSDDPVTTAQWFTTAPANVTRVAFNVGNTLVPTAGSNCSANLSQVVTITTTDASTPITNQGTASSNNSVNQRINATSPLRTTTLQTSGDVLNGPLGAPGAVNNNNNDDFTNESISTGIAGVPPGGSTGVPSEAVTFRNTVQNAGNANDNFTLTVQSFPAGATVKITANSVQTTVVLNGTPTGNAVPPLAINFNSTANYDVEVTLPAGKTVLTGYDTVIRATSGNTNTKWNETIDRLYTGFVELLKDSPVAITNSTGVGGANDPVPGAVITYVIRYRNVSSAPASGGSGNVTLTASNVTISENGGAGTNNWATYTTMVLGP